jgi:hypothetical protein
MWHARWRNAAGVLTIGLPNVRLKVGSVFPTIVPQTREEAPLAAAERVAEAPGEVPHFLKMIFQRMAAAIIGQVSQQLGRDHWLSIDSGQAALVLAGVTLRISRGFRRRTSTPGGMVVTCILDTVRVTQLRRAL